LTVDNFKIGLQRATSCILEMSDFYSLLTDVMLYQ